MSVQQQGIVIPTQPVRTLKVVTFVARATLAILDLEQPNALLFALQSARMVDPVQLLMSVRAQMDTTAINATHSMPTKRLHP